MGILETASQNEAIEESSVDIQETNIYNQDIDVTDTEVSEISEEDIKEAQAMGWSPKENWRGDPEKWVDARTFNEKAYKSKEILRERLMKQDQTIHEMKRTFDDYKDFVQKKIGNIEKSAYQKATQELEKREREAVELGDVRTYERIKQERMELDKNQLNAPDQSKQSSEPQGDPVFTAWNAENSWYGKDIDMSVWVDTAVDHIKRQTGLSGKPLLDQVAKEVRERFPEKFGNPRRQGGASMSPARTVGQGKQSGYETLPPEAKRECDRFVKQGLMSREEYIKFYSE